jgi:hypothetical protein
MPQSKEVSTKISKYTSLKPVLFDSTGRALTVGLFKELGNKSSKAPFVLDDWHKVYLNACDPTEYRAAMELLGSWNHWLLLRRNETMATIFDEWKVEVEVKIRSEAVINMIKQSTSQSGTAAAKWLAESGFNPKDLRLKKSREAEDKIKSRMADRVEEDFNRLMEED